MNITKYIIKNNLTRTSFGKLIGKSRVSVHNYENGTTPIPGDIASLIVKITDGQVSYQELFEVRANNRE